MLLDHNFRLDIAFAERFRLGMNANSSRGALSFNANSLGVFSLLAMSGLVQLWMIKEQKFTDILLCVGLFLSGLLTMSKTFILCFGILIVLVWLAQKGDLKNKIIFGAKAIGIMVLLMIPLVLIMPGFFESFLGRFQVADFSSGRIGLFIQYTNYILSSVSRFVFGIGVTGYDYVLKRQLRYYYVNVPHNGIQEIVVVWGIVGLILFGLFMYCFFKEAKKKNKFMLINYIPFILIFVKIQLGQFVTSNYTMLMLVYIYLSLCHNFEKEEVLEENTQKLVVEKGSKKLNIRKSKRRK